MIKKALINILYSCLTIIHAVNPSNESDRVRKVSEFGGSGQPPIVSPVLSLIDHKRTIAIL